MRYWLDTEFIDDGKTIDLISISIIAEDEQEYYAISNEFDPLKAGDWVTQKVLPKLPPRKEIVWKPRSQIRDEIVKFVFKNAYGQSDATQDINKPEFWAYYAASDWVCFYQLFGRMIDLPSGFPMYCNDIKQECDRLGNPQLPKQQDGEHNALEDARWNKKAWEFLRDYNPS